MPKNVCVYQVSEIPDAQFSTYQSLANGDVLGAVGKNFEHLLRYLASLSPGTASFAINLLYTPKPANNDKQSLLKIFVVCIGKETDVGDGLNLLFEKGPLSRFYNFERIETLKAPWKRFKAGYEIVRLENQIMPLYGPEFNARIPPYYYTIQCFDSRDRNNYMDFDMVLGGINETVFIDIHIEPVDVSTEILHHTKYLARLQSINRPWDRDENTEHEIKDFFSDGSWQSPDAQSIKPMCYRDPLSDTILRSQQRFHETLLKPQLLFHIGVLAESLPVAQLIGSLVADSAFENGSYKLVSKAEGTQSFETHLDKIKNLCKPSLPHTDPSVHGKESALYQSFARLCRLATVEELKGALRLPVASSKSPVCIRKNTDPPSENEKDVIVLGFDYYNPGVRRVIPISTLPKHIFACGVPGSAKTNTGMNLCLQLHQNKIPFLIIEPVKTEYRILKALKDCSDNNARELAKKLEIYTPGNEKISPFRFNALELPPGISVDEHCDRLNDCFVASMPVSGPLPALLRESLERVYENYPEADRPPTIADLVSTVDQVLEEKGYSQETVSDIRTALEVRIASLTRGSIGKVFQCAHSVPDPNHLLNSPTLIELDCLPREQGCLLTLFLLTNLLERLKISPNNGHGVRYAIIIEEAHNIVGRTGQAAASADIADPKAFASELIVRMLAESRAMGIAVIIIDQHTSTVAAEVIKSTGTKIAFRQVDEHDREELGTSMIMNQDEKQEMARLRPGEAFFLTEGYHGPRKIRTLNLHEQFDFDIPIDNENILPYLQEDPWCQTAALERVENEMFHLNEHMNQFDDTRLQNFKKLTELMALHVQILAKPESRETSRVLSELKEEVWHMKKRITNSYKSFLRTSYHKYLSPHNGFEVQDPLLQEMKGNLVNRFESIIEPDVTMALNMIDSFLQKLNRSKF